MALRIVSAILLVLAIALSWPAVRIFANSRLLPTSLSSITDGTARHLSSAPGTKASNAALSSDGREIVFVATS